MKCRISLALAVAATALAASPPAAADDAVLATLVEEALANNPDIRALQESLAAARALPAQVSAPSDPMLAVGYTNEGWPPSLGTRPDSVLAVMVSQDLPWPGKRDLRGRLAATEAEQAAQQLARARLSVAAGVRRAYHALAQSRLPRGAGREQSQLWGQIEGVARARYTVGQGAQQDVLRTQVEVTRVGQVEAEQRAEEAVRLAELNRLLDRPAERPSRRACRHPRPPRRSRWRRLERLRAISPELAAARSAVERGAARRGAGAQGVPARLRRQGRLHEPRRPRPDVAGGRVREPAARARAPARGAGRSRGAAAGGRAARASPSSCSSGSARRSGWRGWRRWTR